MHRATWLLWLMIALLPLRAWAVTGMAMPTVPHEAVASVAVGDEAAQSVSAMPCHQAGAESDAGSTCQACDWCHAVMGMAPEAIVPGKPPMADGPALTPQRDTGRPAIGGLERPPRSALA